MALTINTQLFEGRLKALCESLGGQSALWGNAVALAVVTGPSLDEIRYHKSIALHHWLFGYELPDTLLLLTPTAMHVVASKKKAELVATVTDAAKAVGVTLQTHVREKDGDGSTQMTAALTALGGDSPTLATLLKEKLEGTFIKAWSDVLSASNATKVDAAAGLSAVMHVKDATELDNTRRAANLSAAVLRDFLVPQIEMVIDEEKKVTHSKLASKTEDVIMDPSKIKFKVKDDNVDICYIPMVQSGGVYDLRPSAPNTDDHLHYGIIVCALGARHRSYCANVARTFMVDPSEKQKAAYSALLAAQAAAIAALIPGAPMSAAMEAAIKSLEESPDDAIKALASKLTKNVGFGTGLEFRDSTAVLNLKNQGEVKAGMVFNVMVGLSDLENPDAEDAKGKTYALCVADTVVVKPGEGANEVLTTAMSKSFKDIAYFFKDANDDAAPAPKPKTEGAAKVVENKLRSENEDDVARRKHKEEQARLVKQKNQETLERLTNAKKTNAAAASKVQKSFTSYAAPADVPRARELQVMIDKSRESVLLPIYGQLVPFHIQTVKNVMQSQDGSGNSVIRIQFNVPGGAFGAQPYSPAVKYPDATFVQEVSYRSLDPKHATNVVQELKTLRRTVQQRESERAEKASLVRQEPLQLSTGRVYRLPDLHVKPPLAAGVKGSKMQGSLEAHVNGFRYNVGRSNTDQHLDISYKNIKHAFFQPAENARDQCVTLIHFNLLEPIMVGKKKTKDVQFYVTVIDAVESLDQNRRSYYDPEEIEEEQREKERRAKVNQEFQLFVKRVQELWERDFSALELEFDIPFRELGFSGVPFKSQSFIMPTVNAICELIEWPFFVVSLNDIEIVNLERVIFGIKSFDLALVFKDFSKPVMRIDSIPVGCLDKIKEWLNSVNIKYYESKVNLNWGPIQKSILADPAKFVEEGGWEFLNMEGGSDSEEEEDEEEAYEPSGSSDDQAESSSDDSDSGDSAVESESDDEAGSDDGLGSDESEGMSDDELEAWAERQDKDKHFDDDEPRMKKGKGRAPEGGGGGKKQRR